MGLPAGCRQRGRAIGTEALTPPEQGDARAPLFGGQQVLLRLDLTGFFLRADVHRHLAATGVVGAGDAGFADGDAVFQLLLRRRETVHLGGLSRPCQEGQRQGVVHAAIGVDVNPQDHGRQSSEPL